MRSARTNDRAGLTRASLRDSILFAVLGLGVFAISSARTLRNVADERRWPTLDLDIYRWGGHVARHADDLYSSTYLGKSHFTYPPFAAALFVPLASVPTQLVRYAVTIGGLLLVLATVWVTLGALGNARSWGQVGAAASLAGVLVWLEPIEETFELGQINLFLMFVVLVDLLQPDTERKKGVGVGLAAGVKLTPLIFIAYLVLTRRIRAAWVACATFVGTVAVGAVLLPPESRDFWIDRAFTDSERVGTPAYVANQSLRGAITRVAGSVDAGQVWWLLAVVVLGGAGMALAVVASRRGLELVGILLCALTGLLVSPMSWSHHWVWIVPAFAAGAHLLHRRAGRARAVAVGLALLAVAPVLPHGVIWRAPHADDVEYGWSPLQMLYGNAYVVAGVVLLVVAAASFFGRSPARSAAVPSTGADRREPDGSPALVGTGVRAAPPRAPR